MKTSFYSKLRMLFLCSVLVLVAPTLWAQTIVNVTTTDDELNVDGDVSLREAIEMANLGTGDYVINLVPGATYALTLSGHEIQNQAGSLDITRGGLKLTINGNGGGSGPNAVINASGLDSNEQTILIWDGIVRTGPLDITLNNLDITGSGTAQLWSAITIDGSSTEVDPPDDVITFNNCYVYGTSCSNPYGCGLEAIEVETVNINSSTFAGNHGEFTSGGAISVYAGQVNLNNSTLSGNSAYDGGALLLYDSFLTARSSTIYGNSSEHLGGGIMMFGAVSGVDIKNSILSGNTTAPFGGPNCLDDTFTDVGTVTSQGYNVLGDLAEGGCELAGPQTGDESSDDPGLGPLQDNGGVTLTHAVLETSSALDNGDPTGCRDSGGDLIAYDQRGDGFPRAADGDNDSTLICDSGAFEAAGLIDEDEVEAAIDELSDVISTASSGGFKNGNSQNAFMNKLNAVLNQLEVIAGTTDPDAKAALINEMKNKLINDILAKSNGCLPAPDNNDWVTDCALQADIQEMVQEILDLLDQL